MWNPLLLIALAGTDPATRGRPFAEAVAEIDGRYLHEPALASAFDAGLAEIVSRLDDHSYLLNPEQREQQRVAARSGVTAGVVIRRRAGAMRVAGVVPGTPAEVAGLTAGQRVVSIDGRSDFRSAAEANLALFGAVGDRKTLEVSDGTAVRAVELQLVPIRRVRTVESKIVRHAGQRVGVLCVHAFWPGVGAESQRALDRMRGEGMDAVVVDVRGNPGGSLDEALLLGDAFVPDGILMRTRGRDGVIQREELAHRAGTDTDTPVVVLVDRHTASAAELLAMTLQDHRRAIVVGERTYGKGTVQERYGLSDGSLLSLTIARYFGPSDRTPDGVGLTPDVMLEDMRGALARAVALAARG